MLGLRLSPGQLDEPLTTRQLAEARPSPADPRSAHALQVAGEGWSLRDVLAHGVIDYHPVVPGTAAEVADHMQQWFEAGACDGFSLAIDVYHDGIDTFVDEVIPLLQDRGVFHRDYAGTTLREHLGAPAQYGLDPRLAETASAVS
jgi:alkanesulfonate monooxygenase SsuD/methylene tetrahydromethanopterin reductase-like flavin-dependent oxidoreductase (luciferase family)